MKTRSLVLAVATALVVGACATLGLRRGSVVIDDTYVEVHPGTHFSPDDARALDNILSEYDRRLYWIANIDESKITDSGKLSYVYVDETFLEEVAQAATAGTSYSVIQIGVRNHSPHIPTHSPHIPAHSPHIPMMTTHSPHVPPGTVEDYRKSTELVKRVRPILQKYSQK